MSPEAAPPDSALKSELSSLTIRATRVDDYEAIATLVNLPGFRAGTLRLPFRRPELTRKWLETQSPDDVSIVALRDGVVVGQAGLERQGGRRSHAARLGMGVHDDHCGQGVGGTLLKALIDAADDWLDLRRIELTVYADNARAIRLYEKFGFEKEGVLRAYAFRAGVYVDALAMARLRM
ncbi:GNAT family N-acetyltransferase [Terrarubrum flagellatum]|uniref:GNAT family N-acetyltransferase n=1 Tax=Terrirubrum flagellatum TaxID=2895980 RepID=UPI00314547CC